MKSASQSQEGKAPPRIIVHTDGCCIPNPGAGGWGAVIDDGLAEIREISGSERTSTNNRMEMTAAAQALESLPPLSRVRIVSDSKYLVDGMTASLKEWKSQEWRTAAGKAVKNQDLWMRLERAAARHRGIQWRWVRGHSGNPGNERADQLAEEAAKQQLKGSPAKPQEEPQARPKAPSSPSHGIVMQAFAEIAASLNQGPLPTEISREALLRALSGEPPPGSSLADLAHHFVRLGRHLERISEKPTPSQKNAADSVRAHAAALEAKADTLLLDASDDPHLCRRLEEAGLFLQDQGTSIRLALRDGATAGRKAVKAAQSARRDPQDTPRDPPPRRESHT